MAETSSATKALLESIKGLPQSGDRKKIAEVALGSLNADEQAAVAVEVGMTYPSKEVSNFLWGVLIITLAVVLGATAIGILVAVTVFGKTADNLQIVLTVFTSTLAFITGLFVPSPTQKR